MDIKHITNKNLMSTDFASLDRAAFLRSIPKHLTKKATSLYPGVQLKGCWATNVSFMDPRSVQAHLSGRGDFRVMWWKLNCYIHRLMKPKTTLEQMMFSFHSRHHAMALFCLQMQHDYWQLFKMIKQHGLMAGIRCALAQTDAANKERP